MACLEAGRILKIKQMKTGLNTMIKIYIVSIIVLCSPVLSFGQNTFNKIFNFENHIEEVAGVIQNGNEYFFVGGARPIGLANSKSKLAILKTNLNGDFEDSVTYQIDSFSYALGFNVDNLVFLNDTLLISSVIQFENSSNIQDGAIVKFKDFNSNLSYSRYEMDSGEVFMSMFNDNHQLQIFGQTNSFGNGNADYYIMSTTSSGMFLKDTTLGGLDFEQIGNAIQVHSNLFILCGLTSTYANQRQYFVGQAANAQYIAIDSNFNELWNTVMYSPGVDLVPIIKDYGFFYSTIEYPIEPPPAFQDDFKHLIGRINVNTGDILWIDTVIIQEKILHPGYMEVGDSNSFYIFCRIEVPNLPYNIAKIIKYDSSGTMIWERAYYDGNHNGCHLSTMIVDNDGFLVFGGTIANSESQSQDYWILKLRPDGCLDDADCGLISGIIDLTPPSNFFQIQTYPNPSTKIINIIIENTGLYKNELLEIVVTDMNGRIIHTKNQILEGQIPNFKINVSEFASGVYIVHSKVKDKLLGSSQFIVK
ncbi:MAG: hypothetical protein ACI83H_002815 [Glaciecola sp.]|jgi:hypothetical protein